MLAARSSNSSSTDLGGAASVGTLHIPLLNLSSMLLLRESLLED